MLYHALAFLSGDLFLQSFSSLPSVYWGIVSLSFASLLAYFHKKQRRYLSYLIIFLLGFLWSNWYAQEILSWSLPKQEENKPMLVTGKIVSIPVTEESRQHFFLKLENQSALIRLSTEKPNDYSVGQHWKLLVKLKRIHASQSPGAFDYEAWALQKQVRASGQIIASVENHKLRDNDANFILKIREQLHNKIKVLLLENNLSPWLLALTIGERENIDPADWTILRNTGTNHLMAIAGLHIGFAAGFMHFIVMWCWRRIPALVRYFPATHAGACAALLTALVYSALAGFSLPTQRACIMLVFYLLAVLSKKELPAWHAWSSTLLIVLLMNPLVILTESFWLSFATIALIIYGMSNRLRPKGWWWKWGRVQWVIGFGLIPFSLLFFQELSLISFLANSIAIPWLAFLILPLCLLAVPGLLLHPSMGYGLFYLANQSLSLLWVFLTWCAHLQLAVWHVGIPHFLIFLCLLIGCLLLLAPAGLPGKWLGVMWFLPIIYYQPARPMQGDFWLTMLDVGQGLSIVIQTKEHNVVFDTGLKMQNSDMGETIILPFLRRNGVKKIDTLILSHPHIDHTGGASSILHALPVGKIYASNLENIAAKTEYCLAGLKWEWDGVRFSFLYPNRQNLFFDNNSSCVLKVETQTHSALLTGDIEKFAESFLLKDQRQNLFSEVLIAPHHGSKTSSTEEFVKTVRPALVLYSTGYLNRYKLPHPSVVLAYQKIGAKQFNSTETGTLELRLKENQPVEWMARRINAKRYWFAVS